MGLENVSSGWVRVAQNYGHECEQHPGPCAHSHARVSNTHTVLRVSSSLSLCAPFPERALPSRRERVSCFCDCCLRAGGIYPEPMSEWPRSLARGGLLLGAHHGHRKFPQGSLARLASPRLVFCGGPGRWGGMAAAGGDDPFEPLSPGERE